MEQLQRLAEAITDMYICDLERSTGGNTVTYNGVTGCVSRDLLASGLVDNAVSAVKELKGAIDIEREAYKALMALISLDGPEYQLTDHGKNVIDTATRIELTQNKKPALN
jgi:lipopolysaccharide biosynthesis regulator YciM